MTNKFLAGLIFFFAGILLTLNSCAAREAQAVPFPVSDGPVKIIIASDPHIFPGSLHDDSEAYKNFEAGGQGKMLSFSGHIAGAFANDVLAEKPDAVIITGDLTLNGEKLGHEALAARLKKITDAGIKVLVIPGNHDINNPHARTILNGKFYRTDYVSAAQFENIYADFGYGDALYRSPESLSYISRLNEYLYAVMLDTCVYEPNIEKNISIMGGTLDQKTLAWLEESVTEIKEQNPEARFVSAMHHNLLQHHSGFDENYVVQSKETAVPLFAGLGLSLVFAGHIHIQDTLTDTANAAPVTEIVNSSLIVFPSDYGVLELTETGGRYHTQAVNMFRYGMAQDFNPEAPFDFGDFSYTVFERRVSRRRRGESYSEADIDAAREAITKILVSISAGEITAEGADAAAMEIKQSRGYQVLVELGMERGYLDHIFGDVPQVLNELEW